MLETKSWLHSCQISKRYQFLAFYSIIYWKVWHNFLTCNVWKFTHHRRKLRTCLESQENSKSERCAIDAKIWNPKKILMSERCAIYAKICIWKIDLFWHDVDLKSVKSQLSSLMTSHTFYWPSLSIFTCKMTQKPCVALHACDFYF